ncbi:hypothetical protein ACW5F0_04645 [Luteimonas sp. A534]
MEEIVEGVVTVNGRGPLRAPLTLMHFASFFIASHPARVQAEIADYLGARPQDVCLTGNTTTGLALVYQGLPLRAGDEVLCTTHDHYSHPP